MDVAKNEFYEQHKGIILAYEEEQKIKNVDVENNEEVEIAQEPNDKVEIETLDDFIG